MLARFQWIALVLAPAAMAAGSEEMTPGLADAVRQPILEEEYGLVPEADGSWRAESSAQGMSASFTPSGLEVSGADEDGERWTLGLRLESWGRGSRLTRAAEGSCEASGRRMEIRREGLIEWYVNGERGVEQGFTIASAPEAPGTGEPLRLVLAVEGGFTAEVLAGERDARLVAVEGGVDLSYSGLRAWDAAGRELEARLTQSAGGVAILVDDRDASYPLTVDPWIWVEEAKLTPMDAAAKDRFGCSVSLSGDTALVGALYNSDAGPGSGSAYVFVRSGTTWSQQAKLTASDAIADAAFGRSVSASGDTALVSAPGDGPWGIWPGCAYVFLRTGTVWSQQAKFWASDPGHGDHFGFHVSLSGDTALVGVPWNDDAGTSSGSAYVFVRSGAVWSQQAKLTALDAAAHDEFGWSVCLSGETALVGARGDDDAGSYSGSAYVFVRTGSVWNQKAKLTASDAASFDGFGQSVCLSGGTALIGAHGDTHIANNAGSAYVFVRTGTAWQQEAKLTALDAAADDWFGWSASLSGDKALVGAMKDDHVAAEAGSAYVFVRAGTAWSQEAKLTARDAAYQDWFGETVALSGDTALVGARWHDFAGPDSGAAYTFVRVPPPITYCTAKVNSLGCPPAIGYVGAPTISGPDDFHVTAANVVNNGTGMLFWGHGPNNVPFKGGTLCVAPPHVRTVMQDSGGNPPPPDCSGSYSFHFSQAYMASKSIAAGTQLYAQYWSRDPGFTPPENVGLTEGLEFLVGL